MLIRIILWTAFFQLSTIELKENEIISCHKNDNCYGTSYCNKNLIQNKIRAHTLSKMTCFNGKNLNFTMGTDEPVFKSDGEAPARIVHLSPFCLDQTEVSNLQFYQFVLETSYKTEVMIIYLFRFE